MLLLGLFYLTIVIILVTINKNKVLFLKDSTQSIFLFTLGPGEIRTPPVNGKFLIFGLHITFLTEVLRTKSVISSSMQKIELISQI